MYAPASLRNETPLFPFPFCCLCLLLKLRNVPYECMNRTRNHLQYQLALPFFLTLSPQRIPTASDIYTSNHAAHRAEMEVEKDSALSLCRRVPVYRRRARPLRHRSAEHLSHAPLGRWIWQWVQQLADGNLVFVCEPQADRAADRVESIVCLSALLLKSFWKRRVKANKGGVCLCSITDFNVVISVLSMFIMLVKPVLFFMRALIPVFSALVHILLVVLYAYSAYGQSASDMTDKDHPQKGAPWYITKSCGVVYDKSNYGYCQQAKASFAVTLCLL